jgi:hypothetical protein
MCAGSHRKKPQFHTVRLSLQVFLSNILKDKAAMTITHEGRIQTGEVNGDSYTVDLTRGITYSINVDGLANNDLSGISPGVFDPTLSILDSNGNQVDFNDDYGGTYDSHIDFMPTISGNYSLVVNPYGTETGDYVLTIA